MVLGPGLIAAACHSAACICPGMTPSKCAVDPAPIVKAWMECQECTEGQLEAVLAMGPEQVRKALPLLKGVIPEKRRAEYEEQLAGSFDVSTSGSSHGSKQQYIERYVNKLERRYRVRTRIALDKLQLRQDLSKDLRHKLQKQRAALQIGTGPGGDSQEPPQDSHWLDWIFGWTPSRRPLAIP
jgi:hypothetical protein